MTLAGKTLLGLMVLLFLPIVQTVSGKVVEYDLTIDYKTVNFTGKERQALAINHQIPGPTLYFTEGDKAVIRVRNNLDEETSIHWHGILLPNQYDGVPYVTTLPVKPKGSHNFIFDLRQTGTYWYHSHTNLQEQRGIYGAIVIKPQHRNVTVDRDFVLVLSDWTDEKPYEVLRTLKRDSAWYSIKKGSAQSWDRVIAAGAVKNRLKQSSMRMPPMDISDVYYQAFLINGRPSIDLEQFKPGESVRLRVINGSTSTYFYLQLAGFPLTLISADGIAVEPRTVDRVPIAVAETYDFLLTVPTGGMYELRASAIDGSGFASAFIGQGKKIYAPDIPPPNLFNMSAMIGNTEHGSMPEKRVMKMVGKDKNSGDTPRILDYSMLRSIKTTALPENNPKREVVLELTGNMARYVWSFNNKTLTEADNILIRRGENVRFVLVNKTMMRHPMHLHGHFFRVVNGQGDFAPLKHTVDVAPMQTTVIEFLADEDKDWFFHCHILYHLAAGMARVVHYEDATIDPSLAKAKKTGGEMDDDDFFFWGEVAALSHMNEGLLLLSNTRHGFGVKWDSDWENRYEMLADYERYISRFLSIFLGGDFSDEEKLGVIGIRYVLPFYIESELRLDNNGDVRLEVGSEAQLLSRLFFKWFVNTDTEWQYGLEWLLNKRISVVANHDSDYDVGMGIKVRF